MLELAFGCFNKLLLLILKFWSTGLNECGRESIKNEIEGDILAFISFQALPDRELEQLLSYCVTVGIGI